MKMIIQFIWKLLQEAVQFILCIISYFAEHNETLHDRQGSETKNEDIYPLNGRGLCIVITNFIGSHLNTCHLPGYEKDKQDIIQLFRDELKYEVITQVNGQELENLSLVQFRGVLHDLQRLVSDVQRDGRKFDRFLMFVLSHGGKSGLFTCGEGQFGTEMEYNKDGSVASIKVEEIINAFTPDYVPLLKGIPKCFFFQACRGNSYVKAAASKAEPEDDYDSDQSERAKEELEAIDKRPAIKGENILVSYATPKHRYCFVDSSQGSWFVQAVINSVREGYQSEDILGIMTKVVKKTASNKCQQFFYCNDVKVDIRVLNDGEYCPLLIYGKLKECERNQNPSLDKPMPLRVSKGTYSSFAPLRFSSQNLKDFEFCGFVEYHLGTDKHVLQFNGWIKAEELIVFSDHKYFKIKGQVRPLQQDLEFLDSKTCEEMVISGNTFYMVHFPKIPKGLSSKHLDIYGYLNNKQKQLTVKELNGMKAQLYLDNEFYGCGELKQSYGLWGMHADVFQLPQIISTLSKKMYLTPEIPGFCKSVIQGSNGKKTGSHETTLQKDRPSSSLDVNRVDTLTASAMETLKKEQ